MARDVAGLKADIKSAFETEYAKDSAGAQGDFDAIADAIAQAIDDYVAQLLTSVDSESLV